MSKSFEKVKKKYADIYKWTNDEVELLLTVTKEYKTKQITKRTNWDLYSIVCVNLSQLHLSERMISNQKSEQLKKKIQACCKPCLFIVLAVKTGSKRMT